jgi:hypothetical protein
MDLLHGCISAGVDGGKTRNWTQLVLPITPLLIHFRTRRHMNSNELSEVLSSEGPLLLNIQDVMSQPSPLLRKIMRRGEIKIKSNWRKQDYLFLSFLFECYAHSFMNQNAETSVPPHTNNPTYALLPLKVQTPKLIKAVAT